MKQEMNSLTDKLKKEGAYMLVLFVLFVIVFKVLFFKESTMVIIRVILSLLWLFVLPGFIVMYYWHKSLGFFERMIIGSALGLAITGVIGYNLGLIGIKMQYQLWVVPLASIITGALVVWREIKNKEIIKENEKEEKG